MGNMGKKFKLDKCCGTCEFNFSGNCADEGDYDYGGEIDNYEKQRECWNIGLEYYSELLKEGIINRNGKVRKERQDCSLEEVEEICFSCGNAYVDDDDKVHCIKMEGESICSK